MEALLLLVMGAANIACLLIGVKIGQAVAKGEEVKLPTVKPAEAAVKLTPQQEAEEEKNKLDIIMRNVDKYDGTEQGQEDVPWR